MVSSDISDLARRAKRFSKELERVKRAHRSTEFEWYPYNTLAVFPVLESMLREERRDVLGLAGAGRVLDIGCGDGDLSFFLGSLGCDVTAIENPGTNFNGAKAFETVRAALGSTAELRFQDLDTGFGLEGRTYGLAFCLGLLYHLKNPYGFLETLARHARHCVLSTRIAQVTVKGTPVETEPLAYLVSPEETNNDATNYWIFSDAGLRRILDRTGWEVCDFVATGVQRGADPARPDRDQRIFCMLRSRLPDPWLDADLDGGWHAMEQGSWRWTERVFRVRLPLPQNAAPVLRLRFRNPLGPVRLRAAVGPVQLPWAEYQTSGEQSYEQSVSVDLERSHVPVTFELDRATGPSESDRRELGVQVVFWGLDGPTPESLRPIRV